MQMPVQVLEDSDRPLASGSGSGVESEEGSRSLGRNAKRFAPVTASVRPEIWSRRIIK